MATLQPRVQHKVIALVAPVVLSFAGTGACSFTQILARIAPLLIMPFAAAQFCRFVLPGAAKWIERNHSQISFYMWLVSLSGDHRPYDGLYPRFARCFARDRTVAGIRGAGDLPTVQFKVGAAHAGTPLRRRPGESGSRSDRKNTVLAVWMSQSFLDPISSIAPTAYIGINGSVNSYQIYRHDRREERA